MAITSSVESSPSIRNWGIAFGAAIAVTVALSIFLGVDFHKISELGRGLTGGAIGIAALAGIMIIALYKYLQAKNQTANKKEERPFAPPLTISMTEVVPAIAMVPAEPTKTMTVPKKPKWSASERRIKFGQTLSQIIDCLQDGKRNEALKILTHLSPKDLQYVKQKIFRMITDVNQFKETLSGEPALLKLYGYASIDDLIEATELLQKKNFLIQLLRVRQS